MSCGCAGHFSTDLRGTDIYETKNCGKTDACPVFYRSVRVSTGSCLICLFLFRNGIPAIGEIGITKFLLGQKWKLSNNLYGILPFILGSIYVTAGSIVVGVPTALLLAVFLAFYCPKKLYPIFKTTVNLMAGVPSVVYGFSDLS